MQGGSVTGGGNDGVENQAEENYRNRRWAALMTHCLGNWSGSIGWYRPDREESVQGSQEQQPRLNMRMSFQQRATDNTVADWIVYHARSEGSKDHVVLEKYPDISDDKPVQTFYCFDEGIVGRTGRNIGSFPVVEHGFWADGMRRTVVLIYDRKNLTIDRICYLQQKKQPMDLEFDVSATNLDDVSVMSEQLPRELNLEERQRQYEAWMSTTALEKCEVMDDCGMNPRTVTQNSGALSRLLRPDEDEQDVLHFLLPNRVVIACPKSLKANKPFDFALGYQRPCGQIQILELQFSDEAMLQGVGASWYGLKLEEENVDL